MKNRFKDFIEYYKNLGFVKTFLFLLCIALFLIQMRVVHEDASRYFRQLSSLMNIKDIESLWKVFYYVYPILPSLIFVYQIFFKKVNKNALIIDYVVVCTYPFIHINTGLMGFFAL